MRDRLRIIFWQSIPLEIDRLFKSNIGPVLKSQYFDIKSMEGREKQAAMRMLLDRMNFHRGGFEQNIETKLETPCTVVYRKSAPKPFKLPERSPAPGEYYSKDDLIKAQAPGFSFGRFDPNKVPVPEDPRDYDIAQDFLKDVPNVIINPEHQHVKLS